MMDGGGLYARASVWPRRSRGCCLSLCGYGGRLWHYGLALALLLSGRIEQGLCPEVEFNNVFASFELAETASLRQNGGVL